MALSMDEQRILSEIATVFSESDPQLARHLSTFGQAQRRHRMKIAVVVAVALAALAAVLVAAIMIAIS